MASSGQVYAVSWDGPAMPDLAALLGTWFDRYRQGASAALPNANGLPSSRVSSSDLMVETAVRLRNFSGRASGNRRELACAIAAGPRGARRNRA
ncbi:DUF2844 domain-containing protein [Caballeronia sp. SEWSISQ10-4 2]|nr:DUF2844 domain-containing protein [Caballeronia sp. SEWSISQ10-4 2]